MNFLTESDALNPVTKVGAVVFRIAHGAPELLVIQPRPKPSTPDDLPPIGFVRGTRMFCGADGVAVDANHDGRTAPPAGALLEPLRDTLTREIAEEAGIIPAMLSTSRVVEMGARLFASTKKTPYPIYWFVVVLDAAAQASLVHTGLQDSLSSQWVTLPQLEALVEQGRASRGYVAVAHEALAFV